jgi:murein DD-endopeptidase MepM/ murein hydrolase activator NlpD
MSSNDCGSNTRFTSLTRRRCLAATAALVVGTGAGMESLIAQEPVPTLRRRGRDRRADLGQGVGTERDAGGVRTVWYPFPAGVVALCSQGPLGTGTHANGYSWDFSLEEGVPLLAPADARVLWVADHHRVEGIRPRDNSPEAVREYQRLSMANSNHLALDHGDGTYSWFWHHRGGSARVRPGEVVAAGSQIAEVGKSGTYAAHICFTLFSPAKPAGVDVRFRGRQGGGEAVVTGDRCISATPIARREPAQFRDSSIQGSEFAANGLLLDPGPSLFRLPVGDAVTFSGRVTEPASLVGFYLWQSGQTSEHIQTVAPDGQGHFRLEARPPETSRGLRYYALAITQPNGQVKYPASTRAVVG